MGVNYTLQKEKKSPQSQLPFAVVINKRVCGNQGDCGTLEKRCRFLFFVLRRGDFIVFIKQNE